MAVRGNSHEAALVVSTLTPEQLLELRKEIGVWRASNCTVTRSLIVAPIVGPMPNGDRSKESGPPQNTEDVRLNGSENGMPARTPNSNTSGACASAPSTMTVRRAIAAQEIF